MIVIFHGSFKKAYRAKTLSIRKRFDERLSLFEENPFNPLLDNHALQGTWKGHRSINITGDFRAVFKQADDTVIFVDLDTHHNLYGS